jgi:gluconolactonase
MNLQKTARLLLLSTLISGGLNAQLTVTVPLKKSSTIVADGARLQLIADQFSFTEGPAADKRGNVFFTDQPNNKIWKYSTSGELSIFMDSAGRSNGMYFDRKGNLLTCADEHNQLWSISQKKEVTVLLKGFEGLHFNGPNDLWVDGKNNIYFTDPYYQRDYWTRKAPELRRKMYITFKKGRRLW